MSGHPSPTPARLRLLVDVVRSDVGGSIAGDGTGVDFEQDPDAYRRFVDVLDTLAWLDEPPRTMRASRGECEVIEFPGFTVFGPYGVRTSRDVEPIVSLASRRVAARRPALRVLTGGMGAPIVHRDPGDETDAA